jgi:hypothetical protein
MVWLNADQLYRTRSLSLALTSTRRLLNSCLRVAGQYQDTRYVSASLATSSIGSATSDTCIGEIWRSVIAIDKCYHFFHFLCTIVDSGFEETNPENLSCS